MSRIRIKRVYLEADDDDGVRILVDRLWPRGLSKTEANIDVWVKDVAPSDELRQWYNHDPAKWDEFKQRYFKELVANPRAVIMLIKQIRGIATLLYAAKDEDHNNAVALKEFLEQH